MMTRTLVGLTMDGLPEQFSDILSEVAQDLNTAGCLIIVKS